MSDKILFAGGNVADLQDNPAWLEITRRLADELLVVGNELESSEPFQHGIAVGKRRMLRMVIDLPSRLKEELDGKGISRKVRR